jgi:N-acetylglucosaminyldiphosphoundecaprenol N-acetyl-beta-D-mannosaminyltransferase
MHPDLERFNIQNYDDFDVKVTAFDTPDLMRFFAACIEEGGQAVCYGYSLTVFERFVHMPQLPDIANRFEIMAPEGRGFYLLWRMLGVPLRADDSLPEITESLFELADAKGYSVMLFGTDEASNRTATDNVRTRFPGAEVLPGRNGYYGPEEESAIVDLINERDPDILVIGMSSPKKEEFVHRYRDRLKVAVLLPVGGTIDILAGKTKPIPRLVKKLSLTWFYRFIQEPRRLYNDLFVAVLRMLFGLIPRLFWESKVRKNNSFSIPDYYLRKGKY